MNRLVALACIWWISVCSSIELPNTAPLVFGMTPPEVAIALGAPLVYVSGRRGSEIYFAQRDAGVPGFYPVGERLFLQFRKGGLTGWKYDWRLRSPWRL